MHTLTERLILLRCFRHLPTGATSLRRVVGWDHDDLHAGAFRLAVQDVEELAPPDIVSRFRQAGPRDALDIQGFMRDHAIVADQLVSNLMMKVPPLIGNVQVLLGKILYRLLPPVASLLLAGDSALGAPQSRWALR